MTSLLRVCVFCAWKCVYTCTRLDLFSVCLYVHVCVRPYICVCVCVFKYFIIVDYCCLCGAQSGPLKIALLIFQYKTKEKEIWGLDFQHGRETEEREKKEKERGWFPHQATQGKNPKNILLKIMMTKNCFSHSFWKENPSSDIIDISYSFWSWTVQSMNVDMNESQSQTAEVCVHRKFLFLQNEHEKMVFTRQKIFKQGSFWNRHGTDVELQLIIIFIDYSANYFSYYSNYSKSFNL